jgi:lipoprotein-anchoring transpeptidase ErfK/SrfK
MDSRFSRRDFLRLGGLSLRGWGLSPFIPGLLDFDDSNVVRIATAEMPVYRQPTDKQGSPVGRWLRDELVHYYDVVAAKDGEPKHNPVWYRVWGGFIHRGRVQRVRTIYQVPISSLPVGQRRLAEVSVPSTTPFRFSKARGWEAFAPPLYYESVHWIDAVEQGPPDPAYDGAWYRIFDELDSNVPYFVPAIHLRILPLSVFDPISPAVPYEDKLIEVSLTTQKLVAHEYGRPVYQTNISSGIPGGGASGPKGLSTTTPQGTFTILDKVPSKHMGYSFWGQAASGNLLADVDNYVLPGVPWTCFFTEVGHAFHGTYWHENWGAPMSHGCVNMRSNEANWLFRWAQPPHTSDAVSNHRGRGTVVAIHY